MSCRFLTRAAVLLSVSALVACAPQLSPRQAITWDAFNSCQMQGPATNLERVDVDGGWHVYGRGFEPYRVHACMQAYWQKAVVDGRATAMPASLIVTPAPGGPGALLIPEPR